LVSDQVEAARAMMLVIRRLASQEGESPLAPRGVLDREARAVVEARLALDPGRRGDWESFHLRLRIEPGWHVQSHPASRAELVATSLDGDGVELRGVVYPPAQKLAEGLSGWAGEVEIAGECRRSSPRGSLTLRYQACDESRCLPPVAIDLPLA